MSSGTALISPLRYPGGKQALLDYFQVFMKANGLVRPHLFEPYAGGASIALGLLSRGLISGATLVERDPLIYAFWKCVKRHPALLCARIWDLEINMSTWRRFRSMLADDALKKFDLVDLAIAGLFFNRTNFSGIIGANPIGGIGQSSKYAIDCRFNKYGIVNRIEAISKFTDNLTICHGDAISFLKRNRNRILALHELKKAIIYVDPPYYMQGRKLYRYHFIDRQHQRLADYLNACGLPWLASYDNHPFICDLFSKNKSVPIFLKYTVKINREADELLITNMSKLPLPPNYFLINARQPGNQKAKFS